MNRKGFTLIEVLTVIAILGILVLIAAPKFLGYSEQAQLARIKHDVKVMEIEVGTTEMMNPGEIQNWDTNIKNLKKLALEKKLFETEGLVKKIQKSHSKNYYISDSGGSTYSNGNTLGVGGELYTIETSSINSEYDYKIIPEEKEKKIRTKLEGTFYVNSSGKVYYEPNNPLTLKTVTTASACNAPTPIDYQFEKETGIIVKYTGNLQYLTIPAAFKVDGECWPVKIIGKGAFARNFPPIKNVVIPPTVEEIEEDAFEGNEIEKVIIPPSVKEVGDNAFGNNPIKEVVIQKPEKDIQIGNNSFAGVKPEFITPTPEDLGLEVQVKPDGGAIITGLGSFYVPNDNSKPNTGDNNTPGESNEPNSNNGSQLGKLEKPGIAIIIPPVIEIDGVETPVVDIQEGAFQGEGLIYVELPDTLERIEDYAFAGNQLIGIDIPEKVNHIGTYAFAYNELVNEKGDYKWSIGYIKIKGEEQIHKVNQKTGDIQEGGVKANPLKETEMLDAIWINSNSEKNPVNSNPNTKPPIIEPDPTPEPPAKGPTYPIEHENGDKEYEDGRIITSDGGERQPDGSVVYPNGNIKDKDGKLYIMRTDGILVHPDGSVTLPNGVIVPIALQSEFRNESTGAWTYIGTKTSLVIPSTLNGYPIKNATSMFKGKSVTRVVLLENSINTMNSMFMDTKSTSLDLTYFNTSNAVSMNTMFENSQALSLNLSSFDTSNVTSMNRMFQNTAAQSINVTSFKTSKVTWVSSMFYKSKATILDLSSFDLSSATPDGMQNMLSSTTAKTVYARTSDDSVKMFRYGDPSSKVQIIVK